MIVYVENQVYTIYVLYDNKIYHAHDFSWSPSLEEINTRIESQKLFYGAAEVKIITEEEYRKGIKK